MSKLTLGNLCQLVVTRLAESNIESDCPVYLSREELFRVITVFNDTVSECLADGVEVGLGKLGELKIVTIKRTPHVKFHKSATLKRRIRESFEHSTDVHNVAKFMSMEDIGNV